MTASTAAESGTLVVEARDIGKSYDGCAIVSGFSTRIQRGDRIGIVGPNGSGKTTLINLLTGCLAPDTGTVRLGANLAVATLDQHRDSLDPHTTVADALTGGSGDTVSVNGQSRHVVSYMKDFLFTSEQARMPATVRRRARTDAGAGARQTFQFIGARRTDQRPRHGDAGGAEDMLADYAARFAHQPTRFSDRLVKGHAPKETAAGTNTPAATATC
jgi:predicted ABC-type transport system involved in lysophospholipase L1 biosynthesis ATPase subunit